MPWHQFLGDIVDSIPVVGHVKGGIHNVCGDKGAAERACRFATQSTGDVLDSIPVVGHIKGEIHKRGGDEGAAERSLRLANRSTKVVAAATAGQVAAGPLGAVAAGATALASSFD